MNNKRNSKLAVLAVAVAASAIGAGAVVSGNAMAGTDPAETATASVSVVSVDVGADGSMGEAIECSFDGVDLPALVENVGTGIESVTGEIAVADLYEGAVLDGQVVQSLPESGEGAVGFSVAVSGEVTEMEVLPTELGELVEEGSANAGSISGVAEALPASELPEGMQVLNAEDARQGTPEECAEILKGMTVTP
jgi:hypothetical protein